MRDTPEVGDRVRCNAFTVGVVRQVARKSNGTRVAGVFTGTRYDGTPVVEWFKVKDLTPLGGEPSLLRPAVTVEIPLTPPRRGTRPAGFAL